MVNFAVGKEEAMANIIRRRNDGNQEIGRPVTTFDPLRIMRDMLGLDPFRELGMVPTVDAGLGFAPQFEVRETGDSYVFKADLPGVKEDDLDITLTENRLTVSGKREVEDQREQDRYFVYERSYGTFTRSFTLPEGVSSDNVRADLKDGVLSLILPKRPEVQPKRISLKGASGQNQGQSGKAKA
jgi:HSP20 family protein